MAPEGPPGQGRAQAQPGGSLEGPSPLTCLGFCSGRGLRGGAGLSWREKDSEDHSPGSPVLTGLGGQPSYSVVAGGPQPTKSAPPAGPHHRLPELGPAGCTQGPGRVGCTWGPGAAGDRAVSLDLAAWPPQTLSLSAQDRGSRPPRVERHPWVHRGSAPPGRAPSQPTTPSFPPLSPMAQRLGGVGHRRGSLGLKTIFESPGTLRLRFRQRFTRVLRHRSEARSPSLGLGGLGAGWCLPQGAAV